MKALHQLRIHDTHGIDETLVGNGSMRKEAQVKLNSAYYLNAMSKYAPCIYTQLLNYVVLTVPVLCFCIYFLSCFYVLLFTYITDIH